MGTSPVTLTPMVGLAVQPSSEVETVRTWMHKSIQGLQRFGTTDWIKTVILVQTMIKMAMDLILTSMEEQTVTI